MVTCYLQTREFRFMQRKKAQATEAVHAESVGLEKFLAKKEYLGARLEDFSADRSS